VNVVCEECGNDDATVTGDQGEAWCLDCAEDQARGLVSLLVSEVFGPTFQGEGPHTGRRTGFVRLGLCNLSCEWCDTAYTWDRTRYDLTRELTHMPVPKVHELLRPMDVDTVCLSGGEPLIHHRQLPSLLTEEWTWHVETNGTIAPPAWWSGAVAHTSVSPKINTHDPLHRRLRPTALEPWNTLAHQGLAIFKFVAGKPSDLDVVDDLVEQIGIDPRHVWVMPLGTTTTELITRHQLLAPHIEERGWNTTTRLHVLLYGTERKR
jgi:organic radical activating enzyme